MAMRETKRELLLHFLAETCSECGRKEQIKKWWIFTKRRCNFSLRSRAIEPSDFDGARRKAVLRGEDNVWTPVLGVFDKLHEVGVSSYFFYSRFKCFVDVCVGLRPWVAV